MRVAVETGADTLFVAGPWKLKWVEFFLSRFNLLFVTSVIHYQCDILMTGILKKVEHIFFPNFAEVKADPLSLASEALGQVYK